MKRKWKPSLCVTLTASAVLYSETKAGLSRHLNYYDVILIAFIDIVWTG